MPTDPRTGRTWQRLAHWIIIRDHAICWRCGHPGADTAGHIIPVTKRPDLARNPDNLRAEHGTRRRLEVDGYECIGNYASHDDAGQMPKATNDRTARPTRKERGL